MSGSDPRARLIGKFRAITRERLARLNAAFGAIEQGTAGPEVADSLLRDIHTLKGEAHMMGFVEMNELAHRTEDLVGGARSQGFVPDSTLSDLVYQGLDLLLAYTAEELDHAALTARKAEFLAQANALLAAGPPSVPSAPRAAPTPLAARPAAAGPTTDDALVGTGVGDSIRASAEALAALTGLAGQLQIHQQAAARLVQALWQERAPAALRRLREEVFQAGLRLEQLEDQVRTLRLLQVGVLFQRYPAAVRRLADQRGRAVRVIVDGGEVAVDKQVLDLLDEAILHLVRNSIDHGIEPPAERRAAGKPERGTLRLSARHQGSRVAVDVSDDGRGISPARVRAAAERRGIVTADEARLLDDKEAIELLFRPGFSTRDDVSELSGRGVGLDVVSETVRVLGGRVDVTSVEGRGTTFTLTLPISIALLRAVCVRSGEQIFGLPSAAIEQVVRLDPSAIERVGRGMAAVVGDRRIPLCDLRRETRSEPLAGEAVDMLVVEEGEARLGLLVDSLFGERQVVQRGLGPLLAGVRQFAGAGVLEERRIALLFSVPELFRRFRHDEPLLDDGPRPPAAARQPQVLVVDDSEVTRDMIVALTRRAGLEVIEAVNGNDALAKAHSTTPDLVLTDIDMPVMNGFELVARLRADPALERIPVVVLTSRGSDEDKRRALLAGADAFLVKSRLSGDELTRTLHRFLDSMRR